MAEPMVSATAFSKAAGVTPGAITKALKLGRIQAYSKTGRRLSAMAKGPKFFKLDEAQESFDANRVRLEDSSRKVPNSSSPLATARTRASNLQSQLLEMRLAREQGDVIPREASNLAFDAVGRAIARAHKAISGWAEELLAAGQIGGLTALSGLLRTKSDELGNSVADLITAEANVRPSGSEE